MQHGPGVVSTRVYEETSYDSTGRQFVTVTTERRYANGRVQRDVQRRQVGGPGARTSAGSAGRSSEGGDKAHDDARAMSEAVSAVVVGALAAVARVVANFAVRYAAVALVSLLRALLRAIFRR